MTKKKSCAKLTNVGIWLLSVCSGIIFQVERGRRMTLKDVNVGGKATVLKLTGTGAIRRRIMDMGITKGVEINVVRLAPLGDPIEIAVRGYELSIRKSDAEMIEVQ